MIAVDASVWALALKKRREGANEPQVVQFLRALLAFGRDVAIPGPSYQEILAQARNADELERLERVLAGFPLLCGTRAAHAEAARLSPVARRAQIALSPSQFLTAGIAICESARLLTADSGLLRLAPHCGLELVTPTG